MKSFEVVSFGPPLVARYVHRRIAVAPESVLLAEESAEPDDLVVNSKHSAAKRASALAAYQKNHAATVLGIAPA